MTIHEFAASLQGRGPMPLRKVITPVIPPRVIKQPIKNYNPRAGIVDSRPEQQVTAPVGPDISSKQLIEVAPRTWIAIDPGRCPEAARQNFARNYHSIR